VHVRTFRTRAEQQRFWLQGGKSLSGRDFILQRTEEENYARCAIAAVHANLWFYGFEPYTDEASDLRRWDSMLRVPEIADRLAQERTNPAHYGDNTPGSTGNNSWVSLLPDPEFSHWDLVSFGICAPGDGDEDEDGKSIDTTSQRSGRDSFRVACGLPESVTMREILCAGGLLECDAALGALEAGRPFLAMHHVEEARNLLDFLQDLAFGGSDPEAEAKVIRKIQSANGSIGGEQSAIARQTKRNKLVKQAAELSVQYGEQYKNLTGKAKALRIAKEMKVSLASVYDYLREANARN
jgi:hypothetical protein